MIHLDYKFDLEFNIIAELDYIMLIPSHLNFGLEAVFMR